MFMEMMKYMLLYLRKFVLPNTRMVIYTSINVGKLYIDVIYYARR